MDDYLIYMVGISHTLYSLRRVVFVVIDKTRDLGLRNMYHIDANLESKSLFLAGFDPHLSSAFASNCVYVLPTVIPQCVPLLLLIWTYLWNAQMGLLCLYHGQMSGERLHDLKSSCYNFHQNAWQKVYPISAHSK